jgi:Glycosyltransferase family 9 (heptosyltransferase)
MPELTRARALSGEIRRLVSATDALAGHGVDIGDELRSVVQSTESRQPRVMNDLVDGLCELALQPDPDLSRLGQQLIFTSVVEPLADSFEPELAAVYEHLFARVIERCRQHRSGHRLSALLSRFGASSADALLERKTRLRARAQFPIDRRARVQRVFVPSRVTVGADVAVTSIVLQKIERTFPNAEPIVFGPASTREILQGTAKGVRFVDCAYARHGTLVTRLEAWAQLVAAVDEARGSLPPGDCLFLDPDSRLTQLGLLPVVEEEAPSLLFESRSFRRPGAETLGELTAVWVDEALGADSGEPLYPKVAVEERDAAAAREVLRQSRRSGADRVTTVTLGVGGNAQKRLSGPFELNLVRTIVGDGGTVVLDRGIGEELDRVDGIIGTLAAEGVRVVELQAGPLRIPEDAAGQLLVYQGGLRPLIALVAESDLYVGYDSAFQHIAAALSVPAIDVFVNAPNEHFSRRWKPYSRAPVEVVRAGEGESGDEVLARVLAACRALRTAKNRNRP